MQFVENVMPFLSQRLREGQRIALVTLYNVEGSSPRPVGSQIGVSETGDAVGMITGGCAEQAIIEEARQCIAAQTGKTVRYGAGSPYLDVVLPCGSGIDLHFGAAGADRVVRAAAALQDERTPYWLSIDRGTLDMAVTATATTDDNDSLFVRRYDPDYRIIVFGEGANLVTFASLAKTAGYDVIAYTPDEAASGHLQAMGVDSRHVFKDYGFETIPYDPYTAVVTLFHEHDWEQNIFHAALNSEADYIGALGSRNTHQARLEALAALAPTKQPPSVIHGPVGLNIGAQNPAEISISILAEITARRRAKEK